MAKNEDSSVSKARSQWLFASERASRIAGEMFRPGSGYGDPDARREDEHKFQSAKDEAERLFREYYDLDRRCIESKMLKLQLSQQRATWASFFVAAVIGIATIFEIITTFVGNLSH